MSSFNCLIKIVLVEYWFSLTVLKKHSELYKNSIRCRIKLIKIFCSSSRLSFLQKYFNALTKLFLKLYL